MTVLQGFPLRVGGSERFKVGGRGWSASASEIELYDVTALAQGMETAFLDSLKSRPCTPQGLATKVRDVALSEPYRRYLDTVYSAKVVGDVLEVEFSPAGEHDHFASSVCIHGSGSRYKLRRLATNADPIRRPAAEPKAAPPAPETRLPSAPSRPSVAELQQMVVTVNLDGVSYSVDGLGFLADFEQWNEDFATAMAATVGIDGALSEEHWKVVRALRSGFAASGRCPSAREILDTVGLLPLQQLFPTGFSAGACKLAGLPSSAVFHPAMARAS